MSNEKIEFAKFCADTLTVRSAGSIRNSGITSFDELTKYTFSDFLRTPNLGMRSALEVKDALNAVGLDFKPEVIVGDELEKLNTRIANIRQHNLRRQVEEAMFAVPRANDIRTLLIDGTTLTAANIRVKLRTTDDIVRVALDYLLANKHVTERRFSTHGNGKPWYEWINNTK